MDISLGQQNRGVPAYRDVVKDHKGRAMFTNTINRQDSQFEIPRTTSKGIK